MRRALFVLCALLTGCKSSTRACKAGTLFVSVQLDSASAAATTLALDVVLGSVTKHGTLAHTPGKSSGSIEVDFAGGYPSGETASVIILALSGSDTLGMGSTAVTFSGACQSATIEVSMPGSDLGVGDLPPPHFDLTTPLMLDGGGHDAGLDAALLGDAAPPDGAGDAADTQCSTATCSGTCVDGVCCDTPCDGQCEACNLPGHSGICSAVSGAPQNGRTACTTTVAACAGSCNGQNRVACTYPSGTCSPQSCLDSTTVALPSQCNNGQCALPSPSTKACTGSCSGGTCGDCAKDSDCGTNLFCDNTGSCSPKIVLGDTATCDKSHCIDPNHCGECQSGICVDNICCNTLCAGLCNECKSNPGICGVRKGAPSPSHGSCANTICLTCDGSDATACHDPTPEPSCAPPSCSGGSTLAASVCSAGACVPVSPVSCGLYQCAPAPAVTCLGSCANDNDCATNAFCSAGSCTMKQPNGNACTATDQCATGNCVPSTNGSGSFCCDTACAGGGAAGVAACQVCDGTGPSPKGTCGAAHDNTQCADNAVCSGSSLIPPSVCMAGTCASPAPVSCGLYNCDPSRTPQACKTTCASDADCVNAYCNTTVHACIAKKANGAGCTAADQCSTGFCVASTNGIGSVCCNVACGAGLGLSTCEICDGSNGGAVGTCGPAAKGAQCNADCAPRLCDGTDQYCPAHQSCNGVCCTGTTYQPGHVPTCVVGSTCS